MTVPECLDGSLDLELHFMRTDIFRNGLKVTFLTLMAISSSSAQESARVAETIQQQLSPQLRSYLNARVTEFEQIPAERKMLLNKLAVYVQKRIQAEQPARLTFICTHNSRRSQISQVWAMTAARYYGLKGVEAYSGGTETTAFNPRAVAALQRAGIDITRTEDNESTNAGTNPRYKVKLPETGHDLLVCYSKVYDEVPNPKKDFCAVMCCSQADMNCPVVSGCSLRVALPYEDPKVSDNQPQEATTYDERCEQICSEMMYLFSQVVH